MLGASLSNGQRATVRVLLETFFATDEGAPPSDRVEEVLAEAEDFVRHSGPKLRFIFGVFLFLLNRVGPLLSLRFPSLARLPLGERIEVLTRMERGLTAGPVLAVRALLAIVYYEHPDAAALIGFEESCLVSLESSEPAEARP